jgi:hypothetical protein
MGLNGGRRRAAPGDASNAHGRSRPTVPRTAPARASGNSTVTTSGTLRAPTRCFAIDIGARSAGLDGGRASSTSTTLSRSPEGAPLWNTRTCKPSAERATGRRPAPSWSGRGRPGRARRPHSLPKVSPSRRKRAPFAPHDLSEPRRGPRLPQPKCTSKSRIPRGISYERPCRHRGPVRR